MKAKLFGVTLLGVTLGSFNSMAQEVVEFEGPDNAPIYVMEGEFKQTGSVEQFGGNWFFETDIAATMNVNSGAMTSVGTMDMQGSGLVDGIQFVMTMDISLAMKSVMKQAGDSVRWTGKAAMTGPMSISAYGYGTESFNVKGIWTYRNMTLDPATGEQTGLMSYKATGRNAYGQRFPMRQAPTQTTLPRPTIYSSEGEWREAAGDWSTEITADVYPNGRIRGTGELTIGDPEDPYANVEQKVTGKVNSRTGVVTLNGTGSKKTTSRVKVTLNYVNATGDTLAGKSRVNAYAQKRKF
jgi:hypothetical protein